MRTYVYFVVLCSFVTICPCSSWWKPLHGLILLFCQIGITSISEKGKEGKSCSNCFCRIKLDVSDAVLCYNSYILSGPLKQQPCWDGGQVVQQEGQFLCTIVCQLISLLWPGILTEYLEWTHCLCGCRKGPFIYQGIEREREMRGRERWMCHNDIIIKKMLECVFTCQVDYRIFASSAVLSTVAFTACCRCGALAIESPSFPSATVSPLMVTPWVHTRFNIKTNIKTIKEINLEAKIVQIIAHLLCVLMLSFTITLLLPPLGLKVGQ